MCQYDLIESIYLNFYIKKYLDFSTQTIEVRSSDIRQDNN